MKAERDAVRKGIVAADATVHGWPDTAAAFARAEDRLSQKTWYVVRAPALVTRVNQILNPSTSPIGLGEHEARQAEAATVPTALDAIDQLEELDRALTALEAASEPRPWSDRVTLQRARQLERQASSALVQLGDARQIVTEVAPLVARATALATRLPRPGEATGFQEEGVNVESAETPSPGIPFFSLVASAVQAVRTGLSGAGHLLLVALTLVLGVWSGLAVLYNDKAWGASWADYAAALVWGFAATTVITPVLAAVKQLGTRAADAGTSP
jgi:hypothetical protein